MYSLTRLKTEHVFIELRNRSSFYRDIFASSFKDITCSFFFPFLDRRLTVAIVFDLLLHARTSVSNE